MDELQLVFTVCAMIGGALFVIQFVLQLVGHSFDLPSDQIGGVDLSHSDVSFKALSLLGATSFLMMFGLGGRAMLATSPDKPLVALGVAVVAGVVTTFIMGRLFSLMRRLQSSGTGDPQNAVGCEGSVYLGIPENDTGKVSVTVNGRLSVLDARAADGQSILTGQRIRVQRVADGNLLIVEPIEHEEV